MTVTLTNDTAQARVRVVADALSDATTVTIERSTNLVRWTTVRGGAEFTVPGAGMLLPGVSGSYATTPDNAALDILGDIDLRADATLDDWTPTGIQTLIAKWTAAPQLSYRLAVLTTGLIRISWSADGTNALTADSTVAPTPFPGGRLAVRATLDVDNGAAGRTATFYTAPTIDGPWVRLGATVVQGGVTSIINSTSVLQVGANATGGTTEMVAGFVHAAQVRAGLNGTVVANPQFWSQATGASGFTDSATRVWTINGTASISHRQIALDDYEFAPGVLNTYRVRPLTRNSGLWLTGAGTSGNSASTPDNAALDIVGDIDLRADLTLQSWTGVAHQAVISKWVEAGNQLSYALAVSTTGTILIFWSTAGTFASALSMQSTIPIPVAAGGRIAIRAVLDVDNGAAGRTATFYTAPTIDGPFVQLGAPVVVGATTSIFSGTALVEAGHVGANSSGMVPAAGIIHAARIFGGIAGTVVANPDFILQPHLTTSFTDTAGRTWTVNGEAFILGSPLGTGSLTPTLDRIWLKSVTRAFLNRAVTVVDWSPVQRPARASDNDVVSRTLPIAVTDMGGSRRFTLEMYVGTSADAQTLDYIMASGDVLYLHTPRLCEVPGPLYFRRDTSAERRPRAHASSRVVSVPAIECSAPGPDVAATTATWDSILAAFATWDAILAAFPTWDDLLAYRGDPSEVIVP